MSTSPLERSVALAMALLISFSSGLAACLRVNLRMFSAAPTCLPRTSAATCPTFRGATRRYLGCAFDSMAAPRGSYALRLLARRRLGDLLLRRVADEGAGGGDLAQLVAHHVLGHEHRDELPPVVHGEGVAHELGEDGGPARPGLHHLLLVALDQVLHLLGEVLVDERALLDRTRHVLLLPLLAADAGPAPGDDELVGALVGARGEALGLLAPGRDGVRVALAGLALAAAVRVVHRVHGQAADGGPDAQPARLAGLADPDDLVLDVAQLADGGAALHQHLAHRAGGEADLGV